MISLKLNLMKIYLMKEKEKKRYKYSIFDHCGNLDL